MYNDNYPAGAEHHQDAPWNQEDINIKLMVEAVKEEIREAMEDLLHDAISTVMAGDDDLLKDLVFDEIEPQLKNVLK